MSSFCNHIARVTAMGLLLLLGNAAAQEPPNAQASGTPPFPPIPAPQVPDPQAPPPAPPKYDPAIFQKPIPADQLAFLTRFDGAPSGSLLSDKQFRALMRSVIPDCTFHYGWDMPLFDSLEKVLKGSNIPVRIRDGRYFLASGHSGPYLMGRGFLWIDLQEGIALGGFYFHPTNGEPTPTLTIFSKQVKEPSLAMSQLPPEFAVDLYQWSRQFRVSPVLTRYFITGSNKRILLEHDEDYCAPPDGSPPPPSYVCQQMNADAADIDLTAAYYLEQVNYATNATAWMIAGPEQLAWIQVRENSCRVGPDPLACRIRLTRERTHWILHRHPVLLPPHR
jgi:hypothetical protein